MRAATTGSSSLHHSRRSVATWSLRLRPVWRRAPAGPASSVTRRSMAVCTSSSVGAKANVPADSSAATCSSASRTAADVRLVEQPGPPQPADVGLRTADVLGPQPPVEREAGRVGEELLGRPGREAPVPERRPRGGRRRRLRVLARRHARRPGRVGQAGQVPQLRGQPGAADALLGHAQHGVVAGHGAQEAGQTGAVEGRGDDVRAAGRRPQDDQRPRVRDLGHPLGHDPAELVLRRDAVGLVLRDGVDALPRRDPDLHRAEVLQVAGHGGLRRLDALTGQELDQLGLARDGVPAEELGDEVLALRLRRAGRHPAGGGHGAPDRAVLTGGPRPGTPAGRGRRGAGCDPAGRPTSGGRRSPRPPPPGRGGRAGSGRTAHPGRPRPSAPRPR